MEVVHMARSTAHQVLTFQPVHSRAATQQPIEVVGSLAMTRKVLPLAELLAKGRQDQPGVVVDHYSQLPEDQEEVAKAKECSPNLGR
jgi:hypothetical protein